MDGLSTFSSLIHSFQVRAPVDLRSLTLYVVFSVFSPRVWAGLLSSFVRFMCLLPGLPFALDRPRRDELMLQGQA